MFLLLYLTKNLLGIHWHRGSPCHILLSSLSKEQAEKCIRATNSRIFLCLVASQSSTTQIKKNFPSALCIHLTSAQLKVSNDTYHGINTSYLLLAEIEKSYVNFPSQGKVRPFMANCNFANLCHRQNLLTVTLLTCKIC